MEEYPDERPAPDDENDENEYELIEFDDWDALDEELDDLLQESAKEVRERLKPL